MDGWRDGWVDGWWDGWMESFISSPRPLLYVTYKLLLLYIARCDNSNNFSYFCSCSSWLFCGASSMRQKEATGYIHPLSCFCSYSSWLFCGTSSTQQKETTTYIDPLRREGWTEGLTRWKKLHFITTTTSFTYINGL